MKMYENVSAGQACMARNKALVAPTVTATWCQQRPVLLVVTWRGCRGCCDMTDLLHSIQGPTQMAAVALCQRLARHQQGPIMFNMFNMLNIPPDLLLVSPWKSCRVMPVTMQNTCRICVQPVGFVTIFLSFPGPTEPTGPGTSTRVTCPAVLVKAGLSKTGITCCCCSFICFCVVLCSGEIFRYEHAALQILQVDNVFFLSHHTVFLCLVYWCLVRTAPGTVPSSSSRKA